MDLHVNISFNDTDSFQFNYSRFQEVSLFIFDKKAPEFEKLPKKHREPLLVMLRKGPTHLIRLKHPRLLTIEHQLEESK